MIQRACFCWLLFFWNLSCKYLPKQHWHDLHCYEYTNNIMTIWILYSRMALLWIISRYVFQFYFQCIWCAISALSFCLEGRLKTWLTHPCQSHDYLCLVLVGLEEYCLFAWLMKKWVFSFCYIWREFICIKPLVEIF